MHLHLSRLPGISIAGGPIQPMAPRDGALLAWIAVEGSGSRAGLANLLWPDADPAAARNALRQRLFRSKRQFGCDVVTDTTVQSLATGVTHDLGESNTLLEGVSFSIGQEFDAWLDQQRTGQRARARRSLSQQYASAEESGNYVQALAYGEQLLALEPLSEEAHRRVILMYYLCGDRSQSSGAGQRECLGAAIACASCERP